jgi:hypothetical protein
MFEPAVKDITSFFLWLFATEMKVFSSFEMSETDKALTIQTTLHLRSYVFLRTSFCVTSYTYIPVIKMWRKLR